MGTFVTMEIVTDGVRPDGSADAEARMARAFGWFEDVESCCSRFDPSSELRQLTSRAGGPVAVSPTLYEAVSFALSVAAASDGAFDPTVGHAMERGGFTRNYRTLEPAASEINSDEAVTYRDVVLDAEAHTITLTRPLVLDLGGVAKGLAIDLAARELRPLANFSIDAGGDLYLAGHNAGGSPWSVGIRHPRMDDSLIETLLVSDEAVCTSGDYERRRPDDSGHHIIDPATGDSADAIASVTVRAPTAMLADALATAAFVMACRSHAGVETAGADDAGASNDIDARCARALDWLAAQGVEGMIVSASLRRHATRGFGRDN
jgi:thiamine biosynthesis lipoprotein